MTDHEAIARVEDAWAAVEKIAASQSDIGLAVILCDAVNRSRDLAKQVGGLTHGAALLAREYRPSMDKDTVHDWGRDAADLLSRVAILKATSANSVGTETLQASECAPSMKAPSYE